MEKPKGWLNLARASAAAYLPRQSDHARILLALTSITTFIAAAKAIAIAKEVVVASSYGAGGVISGYTLIFNIFNWPLAVWTSTLMSVLLPQLINLARSSPDSVRQFRREIIAATIAIGCVLAVGFSAAVFLLLTRNSLQLKPLVLSSALQMTLPSALMLPIGFVNAILAVRLMASHRHINSLLDGIPALGIMLAVLLFPAGRPGPLIWGTVVGMAAQTILLGVALPRGEAFDSPQFTFRSSVWRDFSRFTLIMISGQLLVGLTTVVDQAMVGRLGVSANASLGYCTRLLALILTLGGTAVTRATLPILTDLRSRDDERAGRLAIQWTGILFGGGLFVAVAGWLTARWGVALIYQHGQFTTHDTEIVAGLFRISLLQLPAYFGGMVIVQLVASRGDYVVFLYMGFLDFVLKVAGNFVLIPIFGVTGAPISTVIMYSVAFPALWLLSNRSKLRGRHEDNRAAGKR